MPPQRDEYPDLYGPYVEAVGLGGGIVTMLDAQDAAFARLGALPPRVADHRYAPGKWRVADVLRHVIDAEHVYGYRLLALSRGDRADLPNFDEVAYAEAAADLPPDPVTLVEELVAVRRASCYLIASLDDVALSRRGRVRGCEVTARAMAWVVVGHVAHHLGVLWERYGLPRANA